MVDLTIAHDLNSWASRHDGLEDMFSAYGTVSEPLFAVATAVLFLVTWGSARPLARRAAIGALAAAGLALAAGQAISRLADRPRPFVAHPGLIHLFAPHAADAGFPSDHATAAFAIAVALLLRNRLWGWIAIAAATVLAFERVLVGVHYPADVLAGALLGGLAAAALWHPAARRITDRVADGAGDVLDRAVRRPGRVAPGG